MEDGRRSFRRTFEVSNGQLIGEVGGTGSSVILLHGFSFNRHVWSTQMRALTNHHQVTAYDLRGFGESTTPIGPYSHADDLESVAAQLGIRSAVLVGHSLGGCVGLDLAIRHAPWVKGLVLIASDLRGLDRQDDFGHPTGSPGERAVTTWLRSPLFRTAVEQPDLFRQLEQLVGAYSGWHWRHHDPHVGGQHTDEGLKSIGCPVLSVVGEQDVAHFRRADDRFAALIPQYEGIRLQGAGHMVNLEQPIQVTGHLLQFLARVLN